VQLFGPDAVRTFSHFLRLTISFGQPAPFSFTLVGNPFALQIQKSPFISSFFPPSQRFSLLLSTFQLTPAVVRRVNKPPRQPRLQFVGPASYKLKKMCPCFRNILKRFSY